MSLSSAARRVWQSLRNRSRATPGGSSGGVYRAGSARLPTPYGDFSITAYPDREGNEHLAVRMGGPHGPRRWSACTPNA
jgi:hypothetical protein